MKRIFSTWGVILMGLCLFAPSNVTAEIVEVEFQGEVYSVGANVASAFTVGDPISGFLSYDSDTAPALTSDTQAFYSAISLSYTIGTYNGSATLLDAYSNGIVVTNDGNHGDTFLAGSYGLTGENVDGETPTQFRFQLTDPNGNVFDDTLLPLALDVTNFDLEASGTYIALNFGETSTTNQVRGNIYPVEGPAPWGAASIVGIKVNKASNVTNYLFLLIVPAGAVIAMRTIRRKK